MTHGPSLRQMRAVLESFRWITSDQGVESGLADVADCLNSFHHWASGGDARHAPPIDLRGYLLPRAVFVPGFNHILGNLIRESASQVPNWPQMLHRLRVATKFLRVYDYRFVLAEMLSLIAAREELLKPYRASFVAWRWETLPMAVKELHRLSPVLRHHFIPDVFGKLEDQTLLKEVVSVFQSDSFHKWLAAMAPPMQGARRHTTMGQFVCMLSIRREEALPTSRPEVARTQRQGGRSLCCSGHLPRWTWRRHACECICFLQWVHRFASCQACLGS